MNKDTLNKANEILDTINRLEYINMSISSNCSGIEIIGSPPSVIKTIVDSGEHSDLENIENDISTIMREAGKEYLVKILEQKKKELEEL